MTAGAASGRAAKRRRVAEDDDETESDHSISQNASPNPSPKGRQSPTMQGDELHSHELSIRGGPRSSLSPRLTPELREKNDVADRYRTSTSPPSRSRSRSSRRQRRYSQSNTGSRSRSRSRTPRSDASRSRSRSRSGAHFDSRSRSGSPTSSRSPGRRDPAFHSRVSQAAQKPKPNFQPHLRLTGHTAAISQVRISPDGRWLASASADGTAKIWDAVTGEHMDTLVGHMAGVSCLAWAPDGDGLATGGDDKAIRLWDRVTASPAHAVGEGAGRGEDAGFGMAMRRRVNGGILRQPRGGGAGGGAAGSGKGARGTRNGRGALLGHHNYVYCLAFSPKGNILASGSYDEAVFLWDVRAGRLMRSLPAHSDPVSGIDFSRDGTLVASCSTDGLM